MKMPRKLVISDDEILTELKSLDVFDGDAVKPRSHPVWAELCLRLGSRVKPVSLYVRVHQDRHCIKDKIRISRQNETSDVIDNNVKRSHPPSVESVAVQKCAGNISTASQSDNSKILNADEDFHLLCFEVMPNSPQNLISEDVPETHVFEHVGFDHAQENSVKYGDTEFNCNDPQSPGQDVTVLKKPISEEIVNDDTVPADPDRDSDELPSEHCDSSEDTTDVSTSICGDNKASDDVSRTTDSDCETQERYVDGAVKTFKLPSEFLKRYWIKGASLFRRGWTPHFVKAFKTVNQYCVLIIDWHVLCYGLRKADYERFNCAGKCKMETCMSFKFWVDTDLDETADTVVKYIEIGEYNHPEGAVERRPIVGDQRQEKGFEMGSTAPSVQALKDLKAVPDDVLAAGNRDDAPSASVLREIARQHRCRNDLDSDPHVFMCKLKDEYDKKPELKGKYVSGYIQGYGFSPFYCILFTPLQLLYIRLLAKKMKVCCYLDSTGSIIQGPPQGGKRPYYYAMVIAGDDEEGFPMAILEFIMCVHTIAYIELALNIFNDALKKYCTQKEPVISKLEMDFSKALLQASIRAFHGKTVSGYLNDRWQEINDPKGEYPPITIIHICSSHLIHAAILQIKKHTKDPVARKLLTSSMTLLIHATTVDEAVSAFRDMIVICGAKKKSTGFEEAFLRVSKLETADKIIDETNEPRPNIDRKNEHLLEDGDTIRQRSPFFRHFEEEYDSTVKILDEDELQKDNEFYVPGFLRHVKNEYLPYFPLWSAVVLQRLGLRRDSNATVENWFKITKHFIFEGKMKQPIPRFIQTMEQYIVPRLKLRKYGLRTTRQKRNSQKKKLAINNGLEHKDSESDIDFAEEYWYRGQKNIPIKGCFGKMSRTTVGKIRKAHGSNNPANVSVLETSESDSSISSADSHCTLDIDAEDTIETIESATGDDILKITDSAVVDSDDFPEVDFLRETVEESREGNSTDFALSTLLPPKFSDSLPWKSIVEYPADWTSCEKFVVYDAQVYREGLLSLMPNQWINDCIINAFITVLWNEYVDGPLKFDVFFVTALMSKDERSYGYHIWCQTVEAWLHDCWLIPINTDNVHWTLLLVVFPHNCFVYIDSLHGAPRTGLVENICKFIDNLFGGKGLQTFDWDQWTIFCPPDVPDQKTKHGVSGNCGAHLSMWAYVMYSSSNVKFVDTDMDCIRKWIVRILLSIRDSKKIATEKKAVGNRKKIKAAFEKSQAVKHKPEVPKLKISLQPPMGFGSTLEYCASLKTLLDACKFEPYSLRKRK